MHILLNDPNYLIYKIQSFMKCTHALLIAFFFLTSIKGSAQSQSVESIKKDFESFNINGDDLLDGIEVQKCGCLIYDRDNNKEISWVEFLAARLLEKPEKSAPVAPTQKKAEPVKQQPQPNTANNTGCNWEPPGPPVTKTDKFSQQLFKRKLYDHYNMFANGTLSAPLKVGLTFVSYKVGTPYKNTVSNVPGYGAKRKHDGAPPYITIYPLHSVHIVCEQYNSGVDSRKVESTYDCFISRDGEWTCPGSGKLVITQL
jgi:hypothetical protein